MSDDSQLSQFTLDETKNVAGSLWHRWDPHIHMPGTKKEDRYTGATPDEDFINAVNQSNPPIRALGITDYYDLECYRRALQFKAEGKFPSIELIFPNVELRFAVKAPKGSFLNVHLLVCPDDDDHLDKLDDFLRELKFKFKEENYGANRSSLIRLGRAFNADAHDDAHALKLGVEQHKVDPDSLIKGLEESAWARKNILVAVATGQKDGSAQLQSDDGSRALRIKLERLANIMFSSNPKDRNFWLAKTFDDVEKFKSEYRSLKPCLHGCDAHEQSKVGNPHLNRYSWIKGDLTFETLKQACLEPEGRAIVQEDVPNTAMPSNTITSLTVSGADWFNPVSIPINPGLVAIIGPRGSGKSAGVELIAAAANAIEPEYADGSFLERAKTRTGDASSHIVWGNNQTTQSPLVFSELGINRGEARARYLSQQFVDNLCDSDRLAGKLVQEIERVIYNAHPQSETFNSSSFKELRETMTTSTRRLKSRFQETLSKVAKELSDERDLERSVGQLEQKRANEAAAIARDEDDRKALTPKTDTTLLKRLEVVRTAAEARSREISKLEKTLLDLNGLLRETEQFQGVEAQARLRRLKIDYPDTGLSDADWKLFDMEYEGNVDELLKSEITKVNQAIKDIRGPSHDEPNTHPDLLTAPLYFPDTVELSGLTHSLLEKERNRLEAIAGVNRAQQKRYNLLSDKIVKAKAELDKRDMEILKAKGATERIKTLIEDREAAYRGIFGEIENEEALLKRLYKPLQERLAAQDGTLQKLSFSVTRNVDIKSWCEAGESLFNLNKKGSLRGIGTLEKLVEKELLPIWYQGTAMEVAVAMSKFREDYGSDFWGHIPEHANQSRETRKAWSDKVTSWLFSTHHITITYGLEYEHTDIQNLSPGTRGIVLLLLYLAIDLDDDRPLIIDQPEENLDPQSIYDELVGHFKEAKKRRQIIIVTHNANLVVNTDADQVIVASRGEHRESQLPIMSYFSGGLENHVIRDAVCKILEGGAAAFAERARRLRVTLPNT